MFGLRRIAADCKKFCSFDSQMGCFAVSTANVFKTVCKLGPQWSNSWKQSGSNILPRFYLKSIEHFSGYRTRLDIGLDLRNGELWWKTRNLNSGAIQIPAISKLINNFLLTWFAVKSYRWDLKLSIPLSCIHDHDYYSSVPPNITLFVFINVFTIVETFAK